MYLKDYMEDWSKQDKEIPAEWSRGIPLQLGLYWLYSYRYGKGNPTTGFSERELHLLEVRKCANGVVRIAEGQFLYESEVEEPYYTKAYIPNLPITED